MALRNKFVISLRGQGCSLRLLGLTFLTAIQIYLQPVVGRAAFDRQVKIKFTKDVDVQAQENIFQDLINLENIQLIDPTLESQRIFKLKQSRGCSIISNKELLDWFYQRSHWFVGNQIYSGLDQMEVIAADVQYPYSQFDDESSVNKFATQKKSFNTVATVLMSNLGSRLYVAAKSKKYFVGLNILVDGTQPSFLLPIESPRVGILQISQNLFDAFLKDQGLSDISHRLYSWLRLATYFHESRHADGHGEHLAFAHQICPAGHDLAGLPACDTPSNGPYRMDALMISMIENGADDLTVIEKETLDMMKLDALSRILSDIPTSSNAMLGIEPKSSPLCRWLEGKEIKPDFCLNNSLVKSKIIEWDETPEFLQINSKKEGEYDLR